MVKNIMSAATQIEAAFLQDATALLAKNPRRFYQWYADTMFEICAELGDILDAGFPRVARSDVEAWQLQARLFHYLTGWSLYQASWMEAWTGARASQVRQVKIGKPTSFTELLDSYHVDVTPMLVQACQEAGLFPPPATRV